MEHAALRRRVRARKKAWRVYGEKVNKNKGITRRYYMCTACGKARRVVVSDRHGEQETDDIHTHDVNCPSHRP